MYSSSSSSSSCTDNMDFSGWLSVSFSPSVSIIHYSQADLPKLHILCPHRADVNKFSPLDWECRIHRLHLSRGIRPSTNKCRGCDIKPFDGKAVALEIWGMCSTPSLVLLPGSLWPTVVAPNRILSMG